MRPAPIISALLSRFRIAEQGVAAVEFALILPIMLILYIGANEASVLISMDRKVQFISGSVGDLVARSEGQIRSDTLSDHIKVASGLISPYTAKDMIQRVTQAKVSLDGKSASVIWSKGYKNQALVASLGRANGSSIKLPDPVREIAKNQYVIIAETELSYTPLYGIVYTAPINLYRENYYLPRFGDQIQYIP